MNTINQQLEKRMIDFTVAVVRLTESSKLPYPIIDQVIRSSSSVGANYVEANDAVSRPDFKNKIAIAKKEAAETRYWLRVISDLTHESNDILQQEVTELIMILQKIINTIRSGS